VEYGRCVGLLRSGGAHSVIVWLLVLSRVCCVCMLVCVSVRVVSFCTRAHVPLFLLLNTAIHNSPVCLRKKSKAYSF
jgi:hypothetical protein